MNKYRKLLNRLEDASLNWGGPWIIGQTLNEAANTLRELEAENESLDEKNYKLDFCNTELKANLKGLRAQRDRLELLLGGVRNDMKAASKVIDTQQIEIANLKQEKKILLEKMNQLRMCVLSDPYDERDISVNWLITKVLELTKKS